MTEFRLHVTPRPTADGDLPSNNCYANRFLAGSGGGFVSGCLPFWQNPGFRPAVPTGADPQHVGPRRSRPGERCKIPIRFRRFFLAEAQKCITFALRYDAYRTWWM